MGDVGKRGDAAEGTSSHAGRERRRGAARARLPNGSHTTLLAALHDHWQSRDELLPSTYYDTTRLRDAVHEHAATLRTDGWPPERVLVEMKRAVLQVTESRGPEAHDLIERVVRWSIEGYYLGTRA